MSEFIPDLIDVGVDILNPLQISCTGMDPGRIKKEFGKYLAFWGGGVDTQNILPFGTPSQVRENVKRNIDALREDGGFIFSQVHIIQQGVPIENFVAMWETFMENRDY
jgi:uroporphyrinogen decarboxylase